MCLRLNNHSRIKIQRYSKTDLIKSYNQKENSPIEIVNKTAIENLNLISTNNNLNETIPKKFCPRCSPNNFL